MTFSERIDADILAAAKGGQPLVRDTLRMVKAAIKNRQISKGEPLTDDEVLAIMSKEVKQRQEAAATFRTGDRPELAEKEEQEIAILNKYLPAQITDEEIITLVEEAIAQVGAKNAVEIGNVMRVLMPKIKGKADGARVSRIVLEKLRD